MLECKHLASVRYFGVVKLGIADCLHATYPYCMTTSRWQQYVGSHLRSNQSELAEKAGVNAATLSRWLSGKSRPSPEQVIQFARGVRESPVQALVMAGYVTPDEARMEVKDLRLSDLDEVVLLNELLDRAKVR